jgi:hypothetical protein
METESLRQFCISLRDVLNVEQLFETIIELHTKENDAVRLDYGKDSKLALGQERKDLLTNWEEPFRQPYKSRSLNTFLEFLDVQWGKMVEDWDSTEGTRQSLCMTIVQSSCAGKSRLVDRSVCFGIY